MNTIIVTLTDNKGELLRYQSDLIPSPRDYLQYESILGVTIKLRVIAVCTCLNDSSPHTPHSSSPVTTQSHINVLATAVDEIPSEE